VTDAERDRDVIGTTLVAISDHIEALAEADGDYSLVCARYGDRPVPAAGLRFESRAAARAAARATEQYRDALRRYDPQVPYYDVIVRQEYAADDALGPDSPDGSFGADAASRRPDAAASRPDDDAERRRFSETDAAAWSLSDPVVNGNRDPVSDGASDSDRTPDRGLVGFCHDAAAAVFEALSASDRDGVESAVMDAYFALAEERPDPDDLCLRLLEAMASELRRGLDPAEQAAVLADAASRLPDAPDAEPVAGAFERLAGAGVVGSYATDAAGPGDAGGPAGPVAVRVTGYALTPRDGRFPTLPIALELCRHGDRSPPRAVRVADAADGWRLGVDTASDGEFAGLTNAPIRE